MMDESGELYPRTPREPSRADELFVRAHRAEDNMVFGALVLGPPAAAGFATGLTVEAILYNDGGRYEGDIGRLSLLQARKSNIDVVAKGETGVVRQDLTHASRYLSGQIQATESKIPPDAKPNYAADDIGVAAGFAVGIISFVAVFKWGGRAIRRVKAWEEAHPESQGESHTRESSPGVQAIPRL